MTKYVLVWLVIAAIVYFFSYIAKKQERKLAGTQVKRFAVSGSVSLILMIMLYFFNNLQGI